MLGGILATQIAVAARRRAAGNGSSSARNITLAGFEVDAKLLLQFANSFKRFDFDVQLKQPDLAGDSRGKAVTACLVPLNPAAVASLRNSNCFLPGRTLLYGLGNWSDAAKFSDLGINALLETTSRLSLRDAISATHSLVGRGIGVHARVPIVTSASLRAEGIAVKGITRNLGPGGIAVSLSRHASLPDVVDLDFSLPGTGLLSLRASPRWYSGLLVGLCFEMSAASRPLRKWIHEYSRLGT
jgi:hypothetical protein